MMRSVDVRRRGGTVFRRRAAAIISAALLVAIMSASCSDDSESSGCDEVHALQDSLTALTQVDPLSDGTEALKAAATQVRTDLDATVSAVSSELKPSVDQVKTAFDGSILAPDFDDNDPSVSSRSAAFGNPINPGESRWYLVFYRDPHVLGGCPSGSTFNATQTGRIDWVP